LIPTNGIDTILMEGTETLKEDGDSLLMIGAGSCAESIIWVEIDYDMWNDSGSEKN
jgi:hypothetical protein